jgi:hypothetical protein
MARLFVHVKQLGVGEALATLVADMAALQQNVLVRIQYRYLSYGASLCAY